MEQHPRNIPPRPSAPIEFFHALPERLPVPVYWTHGDVPQSQHPQRMNQTIPFHVNTHFASEAFPNRENLPAASNTTTDFQPGHDIRDRSAQQIFHRLGFAGPTPDIPSLSSPSSMTFGSTWTSPAMTSSVQHVAGQDAGQDAGENAGEDAEYNRKLSNFRSGKGRNMPSGRLTCRSWFTKGECDKPLGQCQHTHMYNGQGISPSPSIENHGSKYTHH